MSRTYIGTHRMSNADLISTVVNFLKFPNENFGTYTDSLVNADSFYADSTNTTFQKIPIPHWNWMRYTDLISTVVDFSKFLNENLDTPFVLREFH